MRNGGFTLSLKPGKGFDANTGLSGVLSVRDRAGMQADVVINAAPGPAPAPAMPPLGQVLVFAWLGGLILNLMPCVFPILAMKAVALARHGGRGHAHSLSYTAGVLVTFVALAALLLAARAAGSAAGWGFQFSSPVFVAAMTWLLFAVGLNLSGVFQVGGLEGAGSGLAGRHGVAGSFFTGLLAVLVATPCTAPFMGVAIAAGLAAPPPVTLLVFAMMGLGLASPYVALAAIPGSGAGDAEAGTLDGHLQAGSGLSDVRRGGLAALGGQPGSRPRAACWQPPPAWCSSASPAGCSASRRWPPCSRDASARRRRDWRCVLALAVLSGISAVPVGAATTAEAGAETFSADRLAALRAEGKPVFVNMTAAWCVTCLVNERVAIGTTAVRQAFEAEGVTYLKGDWTRQDPAITEFLRQNGRDGVPLYVFYPPHGGPPQVLPQILTESQMLGLLRAA